MRKIVMLFVVMISFFISNVVAQNIRPTGLPEIIRPIKPTTEFTYQRIGGSWDELKEDTLYHAWGVSENFKALEGRELVFLAFDLPRSWSSGVTNRVTSVKRNEDKILVSLMAYKADTKKIIGTHHVLFDLSNNTSEIVNRDFTLLEASHVAHLRGSLAQLILEKCRPGEIHYKACKKGVFVAL